MPDQYGNPNISDILNTAKFGLQMKQHKAAMTAAAEERQYNAEVDAHIAARKANPNYEFDPTKYKYTRAYNEANIAVANEVMQTEEAKRSIMATRKQQNNAIYQEMQPHAAHAKALAADGNHREASERFMAFYNGKIPDGAQMRIDHERNMLIKELPSGKIIETPFDDYKDLWDSFESRVDQLADPAQFHKFMAASRQAKNNAAINGIVNQKFFVNADGEQAWVAERMPRDDGSVGVLITNSRGEEMTEEWFNGGGNSGKKFMSQAQRKGEADITAQKATAAKTRKSTMSKLKQKAIDFQNDYGVTQEVAMDMARAEESNKQIIKSVADYQAKWGLDPDDPEDAKQIENYFKSLVSTQAKLVQKGKGIGKAKGKATMADAKNEYMEMIQTMDKAKARQALRKKYPHLKL